MAKMKVQRGYGFLRLSIAALAGLAILMVLAALPDVWFWDVDSVLRVRPIAVVEDISRYVRDLASGDAWTYYERWYGRSFYETMRPRFVRSLFYLLTSGLLATALGLLVGTWLTATRRERLKDAASFVGAIPDFVLALLLQIGVVAVYRATGFRIARVASLTNAEPALLLPLISLTVVPAVYLLRTISARAYVIASEDYILVAKATGVSRLRIWSSRIVPNLTAFLRADLAKVCGMMLANFFIVEYLYNLKGVTTLLFSFGLGYGRVYSYQYNLVMNTFLLMIVLYATIYVALRLFVAAVDAVVTRL